MTETVCGAIETVCDMAHQKGQTGMTSRMLLSALLIIGCFLAAFIMGGWEIVIPLFVSSILAYILEKWVWHD